jgi:hypothetical protein
VADAAFINTLDATAYGHKANEKPNAAVWCRQLRASIPVMAKIGLEMSSGGGFTMVAQRNVVWEVFGTSGVQSGGRPVPWLKAGEGWLLIQLCLDDNLRKHIIQMGKSELELMGNGVYQQAFIVVAMALTTNDHLWCDEANAHEVCQLMLQVLATSVRRHGTDCLDILLFMVPCPLLGDYLSSLGTHTHPLHTSRIKAFTLARLVWT